MGIRALDAELEILRSEFQALWLERARLSEIRITMRYFAGLRVRYAAAIHWLEDQYRQACEGKPIDRELASYEAGDYRVLWQN
jgi:hypothetical protein